MNFFAVLSLVHNDAGTMSVTSVMSVTGKSFFFFHQSKLHP